MYLSIEDFASFIPKRPTYAVLGMPVRHSLSPDLQLAFAKIKGLEIDYLRIEISEDEFPQAMSLAREKLCGFNCTHPFKEMVLDYLNESDSKVKALHSCNTVQVIDHAFYGYNTDGEGFVNALALSEVSLENAAVLLLGCGGAASAIAYEASLKGAYLTIAARNLEKAEAFAKRFSNLSYRTISLADISGEYDIVVNATPVGMSHMADQTPIALSKLDRVGFVYDTIYSPSTTKLLREAAALEIPYDNGLSMLIFQGAASQRYWFHHQFSKQEQADVLESITAQRAKTRLNGRNLILSGFMCAGKSTYGRLLADALGLTFIDTDDALEHEFGCSVSEFFSKYGELEFRKREANLANRLSRESGYVIGLGGGTILNPDTARALHKNGFVLFLDTPYHILQERFKGDTNRPLLKNNNINELYETRLPLYQKTADASVCITSSHRVLSKLLNSIEGEIS